MENNQSGLHPMHAPQKTTLFVKCVNLGILATGLLLPGCNKQSDLPSPAINVTIAQAGNFFLYAPLYVAVDAGLFKKQGLEVRIVTTGGDDKTWAAVIGNSAQFGVADPTFSAISAERGQPGRVVAAIVNGVPFWGITFKTNIPQITNPKQLTSYSVATFPSPSTAYTLQKEMFEMAKLEPRIVQGAFGTLLAILQTGRADIALELEPNVSQAEAQGARIVYSMAALYGDFAITGLTTTPEMVRDHRDTVQKIVNGLTASSRLIRSNPDLALSYLQKRFPEINPQVAKDALHRVISSGIIPVSLATSQPAWDRAIQLRVQAKDLQSAPRFLDFVDNSFASTAEKIP